MLLSQFAVLCQWLMPFTTFINWQVFLINSTHTALLSILDGLDYTRQLTTKKLHFSWVWSCSRRLTPSAVTFYWIILMCSSVCKALRWHGSNRTCQTVNSSSRSGDINPDLCRTSSECRKNLCWDRYCFLPVWRRCELYCYVGWFWFQQYANDTQFYFAMQPTTVDQQLDVPLTITERLHCWFLSNVDKSEILPVGTHQQGSAVATINSVHVWEIEYPGIMLLSLNGWRFFHTLLSLFYWVLVPLWLIFFGCPEKCF